MDSPPVPVAIVEDNAEISENLELLLDDTPGFTCVCACRNAATAYRNIPRLHPAIVVMDIQLPDASGIDCTARLKHLLPALSILMFTVHSDSGQIFKALEAGACGYLLKSATPDQFLEALREIGRGGAPMTGEIARKVIKSFHRSVPAPDAGRLTCREEEVLQLLSRGLSAKEIGSRLFITAGTVSIHLKHIYRKLHVRSRLEAVISYLEPGVK